MNINLSLVKESLFQSKLSGREKDFCLRVYDGDFDIYIRRLKAIDFCKQNKVLDAGAGFGQWSFALSKLNDEVVSIEYDKNRVKLSNNLKSKLKIKNITFSEGSIEDIQYPENTFDAIFCYSVIYQTNWKKSLKEFYRVLKPNGKLYVSLNSYGWTIYNLLNNHNSSVDFNPRNNALKSLLGDFFKLPFIKNYDNIISSKLLRKEFKNIGFKNIEIAGEGKINKSNFNHKMIKSFYKSKYLGMYNVYESISEK